jgi:Protein of unknown function (DUF3592)
MTPSVSGRLARFKVILIIVFLLGVGLWLLGVGWVQVQTAQRLDQSSAVVEGRVISSESRPLSKGGQSMTLVVEFAPANHAAITKTFHVDSDDFKAAEATGKAKVTYLPDDPQVSRVTEFALFPSQFLVGFGGVVSLAGMVCLVHYRRANG